MEQLEVELAGAVTLRRGDRQVRGADLPGRQLRLVTALLVLERQAPVPVDVIADVVWAGSPPTQWRVAIRNLVSKVRRTLVDLGMDADALVGGSGVYRVDLDPVQVDLERAATAARTAASDLEAGRFEEARRNANEARATLSRPILAGVQSDWLDDVRARAAVQHLDALAVLGASRSHLGQHAEARSVLAEALELAPLREDAWRTLMRTEVAAGNTAGALEVYEACRDTLSEQLGVDPSPATQALHLEVLQAIPRPQPSTAVVPAAPDTDSSSTRPRAPVPGPSTALEGSPYVGLRAFHRDEAALFFGRDTEVQELLGVLTRHGTVAVVGASGVGKSSLVRAGLLPAIDHGAIPDSDTWSQVVVTPGSTPVKSLAAELATVSDDVTPAWVAERLAGSPQGLHEVAEALLAHRAASARLLLVIDQFEELFVLGDVEQAEVVVAALRAATRRLDRKVVVVVTLRADLYDRATEVVGMADWLSRMQFVVPPMTAEQVEEVVMGPAARAGATLEGGLLARIIADTSGEPGTLPLLQHLLWQLWERRTDRVMTRGAYDDLGGVAGALANRAESVFEEFDHDQRAIARRVLLRTVQPGEDGSDTRRPVPASEWSGPTDQRDAVEAVVGRLVDTRLLTATHDPATGERAIELAHEALIDGWPRLRSWVDEARGWLLDHRRVTVAADDWASHDRHEDWLLAGLPLDEAHDLLLADGRGAVDLHLSAREHDLVTASLDARDRDRAEEEERRAHERRLERRSVRRLQALVALVAAVAIVAGVQWLTGRTATRAAEARQFSVASERAIGEDPQLALLLALEARDRLGSVGGEARDDVASALHAAIAGNRLVEEHPDLGSVLGMVPDTRLALAVPPAPPGGDEPLEVAVHDLDTGGVAATLDGLESAPLLAAVGDDGLAAIATETGVVHVWDWQQGSLVERLGEPSEDAEPAHLELSPDGTHVALSGALDGSDSPVLVWEVTSGTRREFGQGTNDAGTMPVVRFHPDGTRMLLVEPLDEVVRIHAVGENWEQLGETLEHSGVFDAAWSPDGQWLAVAGEEVAVLDSQTGEEVVDVRGVPDVRAAQLAWTPDSRQIVIGPGGDPDRLHTWTVVEGGEPVGIASPVVPGAPSVACPLILFGSDPGVVIEASRCGEGLRAWDLGPGAAAEIAHLPGDQFQTGSLAFSHDGTTLAATGTGATLNLWSTDTWELEQATTGHPEEADRVGTGLLEIAWGPGDDVLATRGVGDAALWDTETWQEDRRLVGVGPGGVAISPDGRHLASSGRDRSVEELAGGGLVWVLDTDTGRERTLTWPDAPTVSGAFPVPILLDLAFSPDGDLLAGAVERWGGEPDPVDRVAIWDWRREQLVALLQVSGSPGLIDWDRAGTRLVVAIEAPEPSIEVWQVPEMADTESVARLDEPAVVMAGHRGWVQQAVFAPDDQRIATCSGDGTARLWDPDAGREVQRVVHDGMVGLCSVAFSPDGTRLAVSDVATGVSVFTLDVDELTAIARDRVIRTWTTQECREHLDLDTCPS